jgi:hypothetical protein
VEAETCLWKSLKRGSFPVFGFSGRAELALGRGKRKLSEKNCTSEDQDLGVCDMLSPIQEPKWKSWFYLADAEAARSSKRGPTGNFTRIGDAGGSTRSVYTIHSGPHLQARDEETS